MSSSPPGARRRKRSADAAGTALLSLVLDRDDPEPLHRQLTDQVRLRVLDGRLRAGARLPSSRVLAGELGVSRTVTLTAYDQLAADGFVRSRPGAGLFVADLPERPPGPGGTVAGSDPVSTRPALVPCPPAQAPAPTDRRRQPLDPAATDPDLFPHGQWARVMARSWRRAGPAALLAPASGVFDLREAIARHLLAFRGIACRADRVIVTSGSVDAVACIARAVLTAGDPALLETPGFRPVAETLATLGVACRAVPVDGEGMDVAAGLDAMPMARIAFVTPSRQFPTGGVLPLSRRLMLIDWARDSGAWLVEDDYDSEIRYAGRPVAALASLDRDDRTFYMGSFSKLVFPGLRLGYLVVPEAFAGRVEAMAQDRRWPASVAVQPALAAFVADGLMAAHLRDLRPALRRRRDRLIGTLTAEMPDRTVLSGTDLGMHLLVGPSPPHADPTANPSGTASPGCGPWTDGMSARIVRNAEAAGLGVRDLAAYRLECPAATPGATSATAWSTGIVAGYAGWPERMIEDAALRLADVLRRAGIVGSGIGEA